jgi:ubiquinone/menaquinone biosynthesis C-methylase UbiE
MPIEVDPAGVEPGIILRAVDFRNADVLEVGAGDGRLTFRYAKVPRAVIGIDPKEQEILLAAKSPLANAAGCAHFLCASATALPFANEKFGIVLLASSL